jgi:hypothetical protein
LIPCIFNLQREAVNAALCRKGGLKLDRPTRWYVNVYIKSSYEHVLRTVSYDSKRQIYEIYCLLRLAFPAEHDYVVQMVAHYDYHENVSQEEAETMLDTLLICPICNEEVDELYDTEGLPNGGVEDVCEDCLQIVLER